MKAPSASAEYASLAQDVWAMWPGLGWLPRSRTLVVADAHLAYEEAIGGVLPLWSTPESAALVVDAVRRAEAREVVFLGDIVHGPALSEGASRCVREALDSVRAAAQVTLVSGNHEGRTRAFALLGETVREVERDGWLLVHGDGAPALERRTIVGHLHPSLHLGGDACAPAFVAFENLIVLPASTPYSRGLDCLSDAFAAAVGRWNASAREARVVAVGARLLHDFGVSADLRSLLRASPGGIGAAARRRSSGNR